MEGVSIHLGHARRHRKGGKARSAVECVASYLGAIRVKLQIAFVAIVEAGCLFISVHVIIHAVRCPLQVGNVSRVIGDNGGVYLSDRIAEGAVGACRQRNGAQIHEFAEVPHTGKGILADRCYGARNGEHANGQVVRKGVCRYALHPHAVVIGRDGKGGLGGACRGQTGNGQRRVCVHGIGEQLLFKTHVKNERIAFCRYLVSRKRHQGIAAAVTGGKPTHRIVAFLNGEDERGILIVFMLGGVVFKGGALDLTAAHRLVLQIVLFFLPFCSYGQAVQRHGSGNFRIPSVKGIARLGRVGRDAFLVNCRAVALGDGAHRSFARKEGDGVFGGLVNCRDGGSAAHVVVSVVCYHTVRARRVMIDGGVGRSVVVQVNLSVQFAFSNFPMQEGVPLFCGRGKVERVGVPIVGLLIIDGGFGIPHNPRKGVGLMDPLTVKNDLFALGGA